MNRSSAGNGKRKQQQPGGSNSGDQPAAAGQSKHRQDQQEKHRSQYHNTSTNSSRGHGRGGGGRNQETMELNFGNIKNMDNTIKRIVESSSHVAIFEYADNNWAEASAVGSLFIYERTSFSKLGLFVMNRVSARNWIHLLTSEAEIVINYPYLMLKDLGAIICIWFYDEKDCNKMASALQKYGYNTSLSNESSEMETLSPQSSNKSNGYNTSGNALLQMLTNTDKTKPENSGADLLAQLIATQGKKIPARHAAGSEENNEFIHPLTLNPPIESCENNPNACVTESPSVRTGSDTQIPISGSSSFSAFTSSSTTQKQKNYLLKKFSLLENRMNGQESEESAAQQTSGFTMQTVEQLERGAVAASCSGGGSRGNETENIDKTSAFLEDAQVSLSNDLRKKLGLAPIDSPGSAAKFKNATSAKSSGLSNSSDDYYLGPSISNQPSPVFDGTTEVFHPTNWMSFNSPCIRSPSQANSNFLTALGRGIIASSTPDRIPTIDDLHGRALEDVEPEELELVLSHHPGKVSDLLLIPRAIPGSNETQLTWTNVTREDSKYCPSFLENWSSTNKLTSDAEKLGINDLPLTADQLVKTFKILLRDEEFIHKFHNAYLQARSEEGL